MPEIAILEAFAGMPERRRKQGTRHSRQLCLALFTLAVSAGNQGFLAIGDWLKFNGSELKALFEVDRLPSYSTVRRVLLKVDYKDYAARMTRFFGINPLLGETVSLDGKTLRGSYHLGKESDSGDSHRAIVLITAYLVERGLILEPYQVASHSNEISALPEFIKALALQRKLRYKTEKETRYYLSDLRESAKSFAARIRGYWGVENRVHYVRDVTQKEDKSRIRIGSLPNLWAVARNLAINLYRDSGFTNMAQAQRLCTFGLKHVLFLFRIK